MLIYPHAKINFGLIVGQKRLDAYHEISSLVIPIPFYDVLEVSDQISGIHTYSGIELNTKGEFLMALYDHCRLNKWIPEISWHLHKCIPTGSGLGGGSSDLAFFARFLRKYDEIRRNWEEIEGFISDLSTDSSFFLQEGTASVSGRGDVLQPAQNPLSGYFIILFMPDIHVDTAQAYTNLSRAEQLVLEEADYSNPKKWKDEVKNDFVENFASVYPEFNDHKESLYKQKALFVGLSGSGSSFYAVFADKPDFAMHSFPKCRVFKME